MQTPVGLTAITPTGETLRVREVWQENLEAEMEIVRNIVDEYPFLAMDTEFPGVVARPVGNFRNSGEYQYQTLRWVTLGQGSCQVLLNITATVALKHSLAYVWGEGDASSARHFV
jgi:hypothetical protein